MTLLLHYDEIKAKFTAALADKTVSLVEAMEINREITEAFIYSVDKLKDPSEFEQLVAEAEELYSSLLDPAKIDIPKVPEWLEGYIISIGKQVLRMILLKIKAAYDGIEPVV